MYTLGDGLLALKDLKDGSVDGVFTDPPWGTGRHIKNKIVGHDTWLDLLRQLDKELPRILAPGARVLVWAGMRVTGQIINSFTGVEYRWMVFCRYIPTRFVAGFEASLDPIIYFARHGDLWPATRNRRRIPALFSKPSLGFKTTDHPCARPSAVVHQILGSFFLPGEYVIDPFAGSDTTGVAARALGLKWDSWEIDPAMYPSGLERHAQGHLHDHVDGFWSTTDNPKE